MNKRGFIGFYLDMWGWLITSLWIIIWVIVISVVTPEARNVITGHISEQVIYDQEYILYLITPVQGSVDQTILDLIVSTYHTKKESKVLTDELSNILDSRFGIDRKVCWKLSSVEKDGQKKSLANVKCGDEVLRVFDSVVKLPDRSGGNINVQLEVLGFA